MTHSYRDKIDPETFIRAEKEAAIWLLYREKQISIEEVRRRLAEVKATA